MTKRRRRGRRKPNFSKYIKGQISIDMDLGTLAGNTGTRSAVPDVVIEKARVSSIVCTYTMGQVTPGNDIGPVAVLVAHSDYTLAEIEEWLEASESWSQTDLVAKEVADRRIKLVGMFETPDSASDTVTLNEGKPIKTKLNWQLYTGQGLAFVGYNTGSSAFATTDPDVHFRGHANVWAN